MKPRLQTSLGQHLVLTPQLRHAIHMLQLSAPELEAELAEAVETNPLLDWAEPEPITTTSKDSRQDGNADSVPGDRVDAAGSEAGGEDVEPWIRGDEPWQQRNGPTSGAGSDDNAAERVVDVDTLHDHLRWQLHLSHFSERDRRISLALIDAIDDDGYLRESHDALLESLQPDLVADTAELQSVLSRLQCFDPLGVGARDLGECLALQLAQLADDTPGKAVALQIARGPIERLPKVGIEGIAIELGCDTDAAQLALQLLRTLDPRPGAGIGGIPHDTYITPDCVIWRQQGVWRVALASSLAPRLTIHRGYEGMIGGASTADAAYLRGRLQEARWLLKNVLARGETLLKVAQCLIRQQSGFLEFGDGALRPLTLREVANEVGLHESTISRAVSRKYARTPRGTIPLRAFFASGIETDGGGGTSSTAIQSMIRRLIDAENPRKPLSDARLADSLKAGGVPVARRTVAKYREAMNIPSSQERVRVG